MERMQGERAMIANPGLSELIKSRVGVWRSNPATSLNGLMNLTQTSSCCR